VYQVGINKGRTFIVIIYETVLFNTLLRHWTAS